LENIMLGLPGLPDLGLGGSEDKNDSGGIPGTDVLSGGIPGLDVLKDIPGLDVLKDIPGLDMLNSGDSSSEEGSGFDLPGMLNVASEIGLF
jgi:hypothetical protein